MDCQKLNIRLYLVSEEYKENEINANKNGFFYIWMWWKNMSKKNTKGNVERLPSPFSLNKGEESLEKVYLPTI